MRRSFLLGIVLLLALIALTACGTASTPTPLTLAPTSVLPTDAPTNTPLPTSTPAPTNTPKPTNTPHPTATPTPKPEPIVLSGKGSNVVDLKKWDGPAIVRVTGNGSGNFIVYRYDANGDKLGLMVNAIGKYTGVIPMDLLDNEHTTRLEVKYSGPWQFEILPLEQASVLRAPGTYDGHDEDVIILVGDNLDLLNVDASKAEGNFIVYPLCHNV